MIFIYFNNVVIYIRNFRIFFIRKKINENFDLCMEDFNPSKYFYYKIGYKKTF